MLKLTYSRILSLFAPLVMAACTGPSLYVPMPQSNFVPPNSTARPDPQHVKATVTATYISPFQTPVMPDARLQREAYAKALQGTDADLITDGYYTVHVTMIPLFTIVIFKVEGTVEGTAVKLVEIGRRSL
jgi:hypothetical protein